jgi:hypothetical protein
VFSVARNTQQVTMLLSAWRSGNSDAQDRLFQVYEDLRRLASRYMARERPGHTLHATALVHEAYIRLIGADQIDWKESCALLRRRGCQRN